MKKILNRRIFTKFIKEDITTAIIKSRQNEKVTCHVENAMDGGSSKILKLFK